MSLDHLENKLFNSLKIFFSNEFVVNSSDEEYTKGRIFILIVLAGLLQAVLCSYLYFYYEVHTWYIILFWLPVILIVFITTKFSRKSLKVPYGITFISLFSYWPMYAFLIREFHTPLNLWLVIIPLWFTFLGGVKLGIFGMIYSLCVFLYSYNLYDQHTGIFPDVLYLFESFLVCLSSGMIAIGLLRISNYKYNVVERKRVLLKETMGIVTHDLRNPLSLSLSFIDLLMTEKDLSKEEIKDYLSQAKHGLSKSLSLCNELLEYDKIQSGNIPINKKKVSLNKFVDNLKHRYSFIGKHKDVTTNFSFTSKDNCYLEIDEGLMDRVIGNLVSNAVKFSNRKSCIDVKGIIDGGTVKFSVVDHGIGMSHDVLESLMTDNPVTKEGTEKESSNGLGLKIIEKLLSFHDSSLEIKSEEGVYTECSFYLKYYS